MKQPPTHTLAVGKLYHPGRQQWPEGADYNFRDRGHEFRIFIPNASPAEIAAVHEGRVEFGLIVDLPELYVISRYWHPNEPRVIMSFHCSYSIHRLDHDSRTLPPAWEDTSPALRALVTIILVEATTGIVLALRALTYSPEFTRTLHHAIAEQAVMPYDPAEHEARVDAKVRAFDTGQLWELCTVRCTGGD